MTAFGYYLLKVILCSGALYLYYLLALKDRLFHQWNRFYLVLAVAFSIVLPLLQLAILPAAEEQGSTIRLLRVVQSADDYMEEITISNNTNFSYEQWLTIFYCLVAAAMFFALLFSLKRLTWLIKKWGSERLGEINLVNTTEKGTPFSFLNYIFWNKAIPLHSDAGQQIFKHELVHVEEGHTWDKLFLQAVLVAFWCNPFFWLVKRELHFVHEFIADKKSVSENGLGAFAAMVLQATYPNQYRSIVNPFFQTSIKRRIAMLTKTENPKLAYMGRIVALPLIAVLLFAFSVRTKPKARIVKLDKEFVVVIDAGHGYENGTPGGVQIGNANESDLVLSLANKLRLLNTNDKLKLVFTRPGKDWVGLKDRVDLAKNTAANLFISLHINAAENTANKGVEILLSSKNKTNESQSKLLASSIIASLGNVYSVVDHPLQQKSGVYVLDNSPCPAVLLEVGYLTNAEDRAFIQSGENQDRIAKRLLNAIENYVASSKRTDAVSLTEQDTLPKKDISLMNVNSDNKTFTLTYTDGTSETLTVKQAKERGYINDDSAAGKKETKVINKANGTSKPLYIVDGKEISQTGLSKIAPNTISEINVLKDASAINKYGIKGKNGVVEIHTKAKLSSEKKASNEKVTISNDDNPVLSGKIKKLGSDDNEVELETINATTESEPIFEQTETPASVDKQEWRAFLEKNLQPIIENAARKGIKPGAYTVNVRFLVKKNGSIADFTALDHPGYDLDKQVLAIMPNSPKWKPAEQNGKLVNSYHTQPIMFVIQEQ